MVVSSSTPQKRTLFLITSSFPFGDFESYLETEFPYLDNTFDKIFIIYTEITDKISRIPQNIAQVHYLPYLPNGLDKWKYFRFLFNRHALNEVFNLLLKDRRIPTLGIISAIAGSLTVGYKLKKTIIKLITTHDLWNSKIYMYSYWCNDMATGLALLKNSYPNLLCICRAHGFDVYLERSCYGYLPLRRFIFNSLDHIYFASEHAKEYTTDIFGVYRSFSVAYLGVNQGNQKTGNSKPSCWQLVSCSSVIPLKRINLIVEALSLFEKDRVHWTHIGGGKLLKHIEDYANRLLGGKSNISFKFTGQQSNRNTLLMYSNHNFDLFINVSEHEGLPVSMMEAMAHGIPVIGPDSGGVGEIIEDGSNGILIEEGLNVVAVNKAIRDYFNKSLELRKAMATSARLTWERKFHASVNYTRFIEHFLNG